jgi:peptidylprolyl isomerase
MKHPLNLLLLVFLAGCVSGNIVGDVMTAENGDHVTVHYTGTLDDGSTFDSSVGKDPLEFDVGAGQMIKGFDSGVVGMKEGEKKTVKIAAKEAYGEYSNDLIKDVPKDQLPPNVKPGDTLAAQGQPVKVVSVNENVAKIDFNHPLAGKALTFEIEMVKITKK